MRRSPADPTLALLSTLGLFAGLFAFLRLAPNRLLSGQPVMLWQVQPTALAIAIPLAWLVLLAMAWQRPGLPWWRDGLPALLVSVLLLAVPACAGLGATALMAASPSPQVRVQFGAGGWTTLLVAALTLLDRLRPLKLPAIARLAWLLMLLAALVGLACAGVFDALALTREYVAQRAPFQAALTRHLALVGGALALALLGGVPLALLARRRGAIGRGVLAVLNLLQTVPSIALFALLIGPLAWLARQWPWLGAHGIGGTGAAPATIALTLYALLPVVRSVLAGLGGVPEAALNAARGMGMRRVQMLVRIQLPLAWPVLLAGLRVVTVQSVGLAAVAALIGAGGLGRFVFLGLGQGASDLVLLGTVAIIALALAADALFHLLQDLAEPPG